MLRYTLRRLTWLPVILFVASLLTFYILRALPGSDPAARIAGQGATEDDLQRIEERLGLDKPIFPVSLSGGPPFTEFHHDSQYGQWVSDLLVGDFGTTFRGDQPIRDQFVQRFPASFQILAMGLIISVVVGISLGVLSALYRNTLIDYVFRTLAVVGASVPEPFLLALLIIVPLKLWQYSMPVGGYVPIYEDPVRNLRLMLPAAVILGIGGSAGLMRLVRTTMLEVLNADYIRTAKAKGLGRSNIIFTHALRNASAPILTAIGTAFLGTLGGSIIVEQVLSINGLGAWFFTAAFIGALPIVQFLAIYTAATVIIVNLIVDLSYGWADPRVRYS
jgi:peptide/nickel transport system permease protein